MSEQSGGGVWINPKDPFDKLLILSSDAILFANPSGDKLSAALEALSQGRGDLGSLLGKTTGVRLGDLRGVSSNLKKLDVAFKWGSGKQAKTKSFTAVSTEQRDQILGAVAARLGPGWTREDTQFGPFRAAVAPIVSILVVGGLGTVCYLAAADRASGAEAEIHGRHALFKRLFVWAIDLLGPTGVLVGGGIVVLLLVAWLVVRAKNPPLMAVITRG